MSQRLLATSFTPSREVTRLHQTEMGIVWFPFYRRQCQGIANVKRGVECVCRISNLKVKVNARIFAGLAHRFAGPGLVHADLAAPGFLHSRYQLIFMVYDHLGDEHILHCHRVGCARLLSEDRRS